MTSGASRFQHLVDMAKDGSRDQRAALAIALADLLRGRGEALGENELRAFDAVLSLLGAQIDARARAALAELLADAERAPKGVSRLLAHDADIAVAGPVLRRSRALDEADLASVVDLASPRHMEAIASRRETPEPIADCIAAEGDEAALAALARNQGARFSPEGMETMTVRARRLKAVQAPLAERFDLPPLLLTHMYFFVPSPLKKEILKRADLLDPALVEEAATMNRRAVLAAVERDERAGAGETLALLRRRIGEGAVSQSLLKELIRTRQTGAFVAAFAFYAGVEIAAAEAILGDRRWEALAVACRATETERPAFANILFSMKKTEPEQARAMRILDIYLKIPQEAAEKVMRLWRVRARSAQAPARPAARRRASAEASAPEANRGAGG